MEATRETLTIQDLIDQRNQGFLSVNAEYQTGPRWTAYQNRLLIDSILRGYPLPLFYLHYKEHQAGALKRQGYDIIDGQQRIDAISDFSKNGFPLLDTNRDKKAGFPRFLQDRKSVV